MNTTHTVRRTDVFPHKHLPPRQRQVLILIGQGNTNRMIADTMCISVNTVYWYTSEIYRVLGVSGRAEAIAYCWRHGLVIETHEAMDSLENEVGIS